MNALGERSRLVVLLCKGCGKPSDGPTGMACECEDDPDLSVVSYDPVMVYTEVQVQELVEALRPFAEIADRIDSWRSDPGGPPSPLLAVRAECEVARVALSNFLDSKQGES